MRIVRSILAAAALVFLGAGRCAGAEKPLVQTHRRAAGQKQAAIPDARIEAAIRARFARSKINADKFQVHVQGGVATIEGRTDVMQHKGVATRLAKSAGAVAVNNHIQISEAARQKAAANLEKGRRRAQIKRGDARSETRQPGLGK